MQAAVEVSNTAAAAAECTVRAVDGRLNVSLPPSAALLPQVLSSPTTKDFTNIMMFLLRQIDPNLLKNFGKLEEEVPQLYKRLK